MFIETHSDRNTTLTFIKSANVQAFPCGRRRSTLVDKDGIAATNDQYHIPFDPESRLNTEANNRKHSGLNGYTQVYLKDWDTSRKTLSLSLAGYLFDITLDKTTEKDYTTPAAFGSLAFKLLKDVQEDLAAKAAAASGEAFDTTTWETEFDQNNKYIYANVLIEEVLLFAGFKSYYTDILRNQSASIGSGPELSLDLLRTDLEKDSATTVKASNNFNNFYFSGLSFSTSPLTAQTEDYEVKTRDIIKLDVERDAGAPITQTIASLRFLERTESGWKIYEPARLPEIEHGETPDSIKVVDVVANDIKVKTIETLDVLTTEEGEELDNIKANKANISTVTSENITTKQINTTNLAVSNTIQGTKISSQEFLQEINEVDYSVPAIILGPEENGYRQLQILRINKVD